MEKFTDDFGQTIWVHNREDCEGEYCIIHNPKPSHMITWPLYWRGDLGIFENIDPEGVGHPCEECLDYIASIDPEKAKWLALHSCNGLCQEKYYKEYLEKETNEST